MPQLPTLNGDLRDYAGLILSRERAFIEESLASMTWLAGTVRTAVGQTYHLKEGNNTIRRGSSNDGMLDDLNASRQHAMVRVEYG